MGWQDRQRELKEQERMRSIKERVAWTACTPKLQNPGLVDSSLKGLLYIFLCVR